MTRGGGWLGWLVGVGFCGGLAVWGLACGGRGEERRAGAGEGAKGGGVEEVLVEPWREPKSGAVFLRPGGAWVRLEARELERLGGEARLGVRRERGGERCTGWVATRGLGGGARAAADEERARLTEGWAEARVSADEDVKYDLWTARRFEVSGRRDGGAVTARGTWFVLGEGVVGIVGVAEGGAYGERRRCLDELTAALAIE